MMVRLYDYDVPAADAAAGVPSLRPLLEALGEADRRALLTGLFKPERMPGTMERLTTLVEDVEISFANALITLDNAARAAPVRGDRRGENDPRPMAARIGGGRRARVGRRATARAVRRRHVPRQAAEADPQAAALCLQPRRADGSVPLPAQLGPGVSRSPRETGPPVPADPRAAQPVAGAVRDLAVAAPPDPRVAGAPRREPLTQSVSSISVRRWSSSLTSSGAAATRSRSSGWTWSKSRNSVCAASRPVGSSADARARDSTNGT